MMTDLRHRFFMHESPVRGEWVQLDEAITTITLQRQYPKAIAELLAQMLVASALLASTLKMNGRLSIQAQANESSIDMKWIMAECSSHGELRGLAAWHADSELLASSDTSMQMLFETLRSGVLFINIEPEQGERYQGIIELDGVDLAACLEHYYEQSAQIPTLIKLSQPQAAPSGAKAAGLLLQLLPRVSEMEEVAVDTDLWPRLQYLTQTLSNREMLELDAATLLYQLYHEEKVALAEPQILRFGCTCSREKCMASLVQLGYESAVHMAGEDDGIRMDCQFCNTQYHFDQDSVRALFAEQMSLAPHSH